MAIRHRLSRGVALATSVLLFTFVSALEVVEDNFKLLAIHSLEDLLPFEPSTNGSAGIDFDTSDATGSEDKAISLMDSLSESVQDAATATTPDSAGLTTETSSSTAYTPTPASTYSSGCDGGGDGDCDAVDYPARANYLLWLVGLASYMKVYSADWSCMLLLTNPKNLSQDTGASVYFDSLPSAEPPRTIAGCDDVQLEAGRYSCTDPTDRIAPVDAMIEASSANGAPQLQTIANVDYAYNTSRGLSWAYNHQVLWDLGSDRSTVDWTRSWPSYSQYTDYMRDALFITPLRPRTVSRHHYEHYRDSTRTRLGRRGPSIAVHSHCRKNLARIELAPDREVHCYSFTTRVGPFTLVGEDREEFFLDSEETTWGFGRDGGESSPLHAGFAFGPDEQEDDESRTNVDIYPTDRAIYLTPDNAHCAGGDGEASSCNWEDIFAAPIPAEVTNIPSNVLIKEYSTADATPVVCETLAYLGFPTYQRDLTAPPIRIHPDWILAGWSVDRAGSIPASRPGSALMINAISATPELGLPEAMYRGASAFQTHAINLDLSLIPFSTVPSPQDNAVQLDVEQEVTVWSSERLGLTQLFVATAKEPAAERLNDERTDKEHARQRVLLRVDEGIGPFLIFFELLAYQGRDTYLR
ncbi:hypothetical protein BJX62DRAFT_238158 [Aspergillus germanicus]